VDYHFLDAAAFQARVDTGEFLEHAMVHGHRYGTLQVEALERLRQGQDVLLAIDVQGAATIRTQATQREELRRALVSVFLVPPSLAVLEERLRRRGQDTPEAVRKRLSVARQETAQGKFFDYLIISDSIANDLRRMQIILEAEKLRQGRVSMPDW
jgi:guanylate kinase